MWTQRHIKITACDRHRPLTLRIAEISRHHNMTSCLCAEHYHRHISIRGISNHTAAGGDKM